MTALMRAGSVCLTPADCPRPRRAGAARRRAGCRLCVATGGCQAADLPWSGRCRQTASHSWSDRAPWLPRQGRPTCRLSRAPLHVGYHCQVEVMIHALSVSVAASAACDGVIIMGLQVYAGDCPLGARCCAAHGLGELRVLAAIALGILPRTYKTQRCRAFDTKDGCPAGARSLARQPAFPRAQNCSGRLLDELVYLLGGMS